MYNLQVGIEVLIKENGMDESWVQIPYDTYCISLWTNDLGKGMGPSLLHPHLAKDK